MTIYIQQKDSHGDLITVDEFDNKKDARDALKEYKICAPYNDYYLSRRACKDWAISHRDRDVTLEVTAEFHC